MMAPLLDGALELLAANLDHHPMHPQLEGYKFGAMVEDARAVGLLLDASSYRCFRADIDLALGRRKGSLTLMLPEREIKKEAELDENGQIAKGQHEDQMSRVPARLDTVLARVAMPLSRANELKVGDLLMLGTDAKDGVEVLAGGSQIVAKGALGQINGMRAVRLTWPPRPEPEVPVAADVPALAEPGAGLALTADAAPAALPDLEMDFGGGEEPAAIELDMDFGGGEPAVEEPVFDPSVPEELPDLPSLDFEAESGALDLDLDFLDAPAADGDGEGLGDFDFSSAPLELEEN
jgi:flagellar motor switch protein FliM